MSEQKVDEGCRSFVSDGTGDGAERLADEDAADLGYVMNATRVWGHLPDPHDGLFHLMGQAVRAAGISFRERGILVVACASALGDSYCSLAWGGKLAREAGAPVAASVLTGSDDMLSPREQGLATWARRVARDPNATTADDLAPLRDAGLSDAQIVAVTTFVALRLAFSTVNDALGARPDRELADGLPPEVRDAVTFGRPPL
jgi:uncharacterized peroxidase-related enzyme